MLFLIFTLLTSNFIQPAGASTLVWSATFESGSWLPYFDSEPSTTCGAVNTVSATVHFEGHYSGYYYHTGGICNESIRAYPREQLNKTLTNFRLQVMVYVPSVLITDWLSFITMHLSDGSFITVDSSLMNIDGVVQPVLHLWNGALPVGSRIIKQVDPVAWSFDEWLNLTIVGSLRPGKDSSGITLYQDGRIVINYVGYAGNGSLEWMHFGLYTGPEQAIFAVYNDDIMLWQL